MRFRPKQLHRSFVTRRAICFEKFYPNQCANERGTFLEMQSLPGWHPHGLLAKLERFTLICWPMSAIQLEKLAMISTRHFRTRTLRFRSTRYYASLMKKFFNSEKYPRFEEFWRRIPFESQDDYSIPIEKPDLGNSRAFVEVESLLSLTPYGELSMHQLLPLTMATAKRVEKIMNKVGHGYTELAPFPDKRKQ